MNRCETCRHWAPVFENGEVRQGACILLSFQLAPRPAVALDGELLDLDGPQTWGPSNAEELGAVAEVHRLEFDAPDDDLPRRRSLYAGPDPLDVRLFTPAGFGCTLHAADRDDDEDGEGAEEAPVDPRPLAAAH